MVVRIQKVIIIKYKRANNGLRCSSRHIRSIERQQPPSSEDGGGGPGEVVVEPHVGLAAPHTRHAVNAVQQRPQVSDGEKVVNPCLANTRHLSCFLWLRKFDIQGFHFVFLNFVKNYAFSIGKKKELYLE